MDGDDFDAAAAAATATGDEPDPTPSDGGDVAGETEADPSPSEPSGSGSGSWIKDALMSTDPDPPLESVDSPYDPENGGLARLYRGLMKMAGISGTPAIIDVGIGAVETLQEAQPAQPEGGADETDDGAAGEEADYL
jgi:hypothetical protein